MDLHAYVANNPVNWVDPFDLEMVSLETGVMVVK